MNAVIILFSVLAVTFGQHQHRTHPPHPTHPPDHTDHPDLHAHNQNLHESFSFKHDGHSHKIVAMIGHDECYIYTLTTQEQIDLSSRADYLRTIEFNMVQLIQKNQGSTSPPPTTSAPHDHGHHAPAQHDLCHGAQNVVTLN